MVDAYFGPPGLADEGRAAPPPPPPELAGGGQKLLGELEDGWLRDQVAGLRVYAGVLAGESLPFADEAEGCYGVRPVHTDEEVFAEAHRQLDQLLPGTGPVGERHERWRRSTRVP